MSTGDGGPIAVDDGPLSESEALRRMYRITTDRKRPFEKKLQMLLVVGRAYFGTEAGFLSKLSEGTQLIVEASGEHELLQPGESCPLSQSYCRKTLDQEGPLAVQHAAIEGWEGDAAYDVFGLESYIGAKVFVDGDVYGTFCFADSEPREEPFTAEQEMFVELMAQWVGYELFNRRATDRIVAQRDRLQEFTKVVSHDLRNPLNVMQNYLELAERTGNPEYFHRCQNALDRMGSLIDDLLTLAEKGNETVETETVALSALTAECWSLVATADATLQVETELQISGDRGQLRQLFENLFRNAIEHGGPDVAIRIGELTDGDGLYVEDNGPGIPPEDREQVFDDGYTTSRQGTGFGLSIVKQVTDAHGWDIRATDGTDGGARFEITGVEHTG